ncbi:MAG: hypothetical protein WAS07_03900 [Micropruina sp.]
MSEPGQVLSAFFTRVEQGYYNSVEKIDHPETIRRVEARERDLRSALLEEGIAPARIEATVLWAIRRAEERERGVVEGRYPTPLYSGYLLRIVFLIRLVRGLEPTP